MEDELAKKRVGNLSQRMNEIMIDLKIKGKCVRSKTHRHLASCDIRLDGGEPVAKIIKNTTNIALSLRCETEPIVETLLSEGLVRLKFATRAPDIITYKELLLGGRYKIPRAEDNLLPFILGEDDNGDPLIVDMARNPHLLIAGNTGSGKSVMLHNLITNASILRQSKRRNIQLYLVDPKEVEFASYKNDDYAGLISDVCTTYEETVVLLEQLVYDMNYRYSVMREAGVQSISDEPSMFPITMVIIDELSELMMHDKKSKEMQMLLTTLAAKARAAGMFFVAATQRPSKDVLSTTIKANFPARCSFKVKAGYDSKVILDEVGAEKLFGRGDGLFSGGVHDMVRFQGAFVTPEDVLENHLTVEFTSGNKAAVG